MKKRRKGGKKEYPQIQESPNVHFTFDKPEKKWKSVIKTILTYLGIIGSIVCAAIAIWSIWPEPKEEKLRNSINENVATILQTFHPEEIKDDSLHQECKHIKEFQLYAREYATKWRAVKSIDDISKFKNYTSQEIYNVIISQMKEYTSFNESIIPLLDKIDKILDYGNEHNFYALKPNKAKVLDIINLAKKRVEVNTINEDYLIKNIDLLSKKYGSEKDIPSEKLIELYKPYQKHFNGVEELSFVDKLTSYIIELNSQYMLYLKRQNNY